MMRGVVRTNRIDAAIDLAREILGHAHGQARTNLVLYLARLSSVDLAELYLDRDLTATQCRESLS